MNERALSASPPIAIVFCLGLAGLLALGPVQAAPAEEAALELPYVYTEWQHFTTQEGLPNDVIFAIKAHGPDVWIGTEDGLARLDKRTGEIRTWGMEDGLPWKVITGLAVHPKTGDLWIGLFGGGLARFSGGRFDHWHQLNSGLVNDVVYGLAIHGDHVWVATTAGANRFDTITGEWKIFTEKNAPMEEIWNYGVYASPDWIHLAVWGSGVLEYEVATGRWNVYLDPDGEMEVVLHRDDGIVHVITTGVNYVEDIMWVSSYFGASRYDGRNWRGYFAFETGLPNDFINSLRARSANEAWFCTDQGLGVVTDFETDTWVTYTMDPSTGGGVAEISKAGEMVKTLRLARTIPHNFTICADIDGDDVWVGTSKGVGRAVGRDYYARLKPVAPSELAAWAGERPAVAIQIDAEEGR